VTSASPAPLTAPDVLALLARLDEIAERVILVGGQAVNLWAEHYLAQGRVPELLVDVPYTSKDVDFCASKEVVRAFAARLPQGRARFPSLDDATPNTGIVMFVDDAGRERVIDFLAAPFGLDAKEVERDAVSMDVLDAQGQATGRRFRVMHPIASMESRVHNVVGLAHTYDTPHGRKQLRASVVCAREALKDLLDTPAAEGFDPVRTVLDLNERIFDLCLHDHHGRVVHQRTGIDPFDAVFVDPRLGERFVATRYPQVRARLAAARKKRAPK
jgi:hypothetical protein